MRSATRSVNETLPGATGASGGRRTDFVDIVVTVQGEE